MKTRLTTFALSAFIVAALAIPALAAETQTVTTTVVEPVSQATQPIPAAIALYQDVPGFSDMTGLPAVADIDDELPTEGSYFGWIDADGTPLKLSRENDDILVRGDNRPVARIRITDMNGLIEPQLSQPIVAVARN